MNYNCTNCGKLLKPNDQVFFSMPLPPRGFVELQAWLKLNGAKPYCVDCIRLVAKK